MQCMHRAVALAAVEYQGSTSRHGRDPTLSVHLCMCCSLEACGRTPNWPVWSEADRWRVHACRVPFQFVLHTLGSMVWHTASLVQPFGSAAPRVREAVRQAKACRQKPRVRQKGISLTQHFSYRYWDLLDAEFGKPSDGQKRAVRRHMSDPGRQPDAQRRLAAKSTVR